MGKNPIIQSIRLTRYKFPFQDVGYDLSFAMGAFYEPGSNGSRSVLGLRIETDLGVTGEYMSIAPGTYEQIQMFASFLIGKNALERELFYNQALPMFASGNCEARRSLKRMAEFTCYTLSPVRMGSAS